MGHFVGVYTDELPTLQSIIGSKSPEQFASVLKACGGKFYHEPATHDRIAAALKDIIAGSYPHGEHEEGAYYIYAFADLCRAVARKWTVQEIYVDEEEFPDIWCFVWGSVDDEADFHLLPDDTFQLPKAQVGPMMWHRDLKLVKQEIKRLSNLDFEEIAGLNDTDYREEVAAILEVLRAAEQSGQGVWITFQE